MMNIRELKVQELAEQDVLSCEVGHWSIAAVFATVGLFYQFGKYSYAIHPESFI